MSMYLRPLSLALLATGFGTVPPAAARGIDCRDVLVPVEQAICSTPALRASDARIARRYFFLRKTLDANAADALRDDQRWFIKARDLAVERLRGADLITELIDRYAARAAFLDAIETRLAPGIAGTWDNIAGRLTLTLTKDGGYALDGSGADPAMQGWSCEIAIEGHGDARDKASFPVPPAPGLDGWTIATARKGAMLWVEERPEGRNANVRPYCGARGMIGGAYFRLRTKGA